MNWRWKKEKKKKQTRLLATLSQKLYVIFLTLAFDDKNKGWQQLKGLSLSLEKENNNTTARKMGVWYDPFHSSFSYSTETFRWFCVSAIN